MSFPSRTVTAPAPEPACTFGTVLAPVDARTGAVLFLLQDGQGVGWRGAPPVTGLAGTLTLQASGGPPAPIKGGFVDVVDVHGALVASVTADMRGVWEAWWPNIPPGDYQLRVNRNDVTCPRVPAHVSAGRFTTGIVVRCSKRA